MKEGLDSISYTYHIGCRHQGNDMELLGFKIFPTCNASFLDPTFKVQHLDDNELPLIKQRVIRESDELMGSGSINEDSEDNHIQLHI